MEISATKKAGLSRPSVVTSRRCQYIRGQQREGLSTQMYALIVTVASRPVGLDMPVSAPLGSHPNGLSLPTAGKRSGNGLPMS